MSSVSVAGLVGVMGGQWPLSGLGSRSLHPKDGVSVSHLSGEAAVQRPIESSRVISCWGWSNIDPEARAGAPQGLSTSPVSVITFPPINN